MKLYTADRASDLLSGLFRIGGPDAYYKVINALWTRVPVRSAYDIRVCTPDRVSPDAAERPVVERVFAAYQQAKRDQRDHDAIFLPGGGWKNVLESSYARLIESSETNDIKRFHHFLANFGAWETRTGIGESWTFSRLTASKHKTANFEQRVIAPLIEWWETYESHGRSLEALEIPRFGNQVGVLVNGHYILPNSVFSDFYARLLAGFLPRERPVIAELGGGFGRLCCFLFRSFSQPTYVGFDLPECLSLASYYLMMSFPEKRFLLYGEGDLAPDSLSKYDFILRPSFEISRLEDASVDLFINENSLGVMHPALCRLFVKEICRSANAFWHRNHEVRCNPFEDGTTSLVNHEYPIDRERFRQVVRFCDVARLIGHARPAVENDMYWYYFRREASGQLDT